MYLLLDYQAMSFLNFTVGNDCHITAVLYFEVSWHTLKAIATVKTWVLHLVMVRVRFST